MLVIVTGTSKGIGHELVKLLAVHQDLVVLAVSRTATKFKSKNVISVQADINTVSGRTKIYNAAVKTGKKVEIIINNAGLLVKKPFEKLSEKELLAVYSTNVFAPFLLIQKILPLVKRNANSHIVNIGSMGGFQGSSKFAGLSAYSSSKSAIAGLSECLAEELSSKKIAVNCLALGSAQTQMLSQAFPGYKAPLSAKDMAGYIAWFALEGQKYMNGKVIPVSLKTP
ncbi:MAG: SDR family oxidoreductase [Sphingobacteriaceae bacterium]|nr:SDR family oxidoreductase [Sphingobacteriaceae bacterium]